MVLDSKKEVDRHVRNSFSKLRTDNEKNSRSFAIARLYYKIAEYSMAQHYITCYLNFKEDYAPAHKLLGQCYEKLKKYDKALLSYQRSLQLEKKQNDLISSVCKLLLTENIQFNPNTVRYWCDVADGENIQNSDVFNLKFKLLNMDNMDKKQIEDIIKKEIQNFPNNIELKTRLVKHFIDLNNINDGFQYVYDTEMKFSNILSIQTIDWYNTVYKLLDKYKTINTNNKYNTWEYWLLMIITLERSIFLNLCTDTSNNNNIVDCTNLLCEFDQKLFEASKTVINICKERELAAQFICHYRGQLCLHATTLLYKREKYLNKNQWLSTTKHCLPLLLLAYNCGIADTNELWLKNTNDVTRHLIELWNREGAFRCVQSGRTICSLMCNNINESNYYDNSILEQIKQYSNDTKLWENSNAIIQEVKNYCTIPDWRRILYKLIFIKDDKMSTSYFMQNNLFNDIIYDIPIQSDLESYEEIAQLLLPSSLNFLVYLGLGKINNLYDLNCLFMYKNLNFSIQNLINCNAETLNRLDIDSYLYCTIIQTKRLLNNEKINYEIINRKSYTKPFILPYPVMINTMATDEQQDWWLSAYKMCNNLSNENWSDLRITLQYGIEVIRCVGTPKIDLIILLKLGCILNSRLKDMNKINERNFLEKRIETIYKYCLHMLKMLKNGNLETYRKYFKYPTNNYDNIDRDVSVLSEDAVTYLAAIYMKKGEYEELIEEFSDLQLPFATYFQAEAYRKLDESSKTPKKTKKIYLEKSRDLLNQTLSLLEYPNVDRNHPLHNIINSDIQRLQFSNKFLSSNNDTMNGSLNYSYQQAQPDRFQHGDELLNDSYSRNSNNRNSSNNNMELMTTMMDSLSMVKIDVTSTRQEISDIYTKVALINSKISNIEDLMNSKINNIEELIKKMMSNNIQSSGVEDNPIALDDLYIFDEELQNQGYPSQNNNANNINSSTQMFGQHLHQPQPRLNTPTQLLQQSQAAAAAAAAYNNSYNTSYPMFLYSLPGAAAAAAAAAVAQQGPSQQPYCDKPGSVPISPYMEPASVAAVLSYQQYQQQLQNQSPQIGMGNNTNSNNLLMTSYPSSVNNGHQPLLRQNNMFESLYQQQQSSTVAPMSTQQSSMMPMTGLGSIKTGQTPAIEQALSTPSLLKSWNFAYNNTPVEKSPPVNVVITSSDPLPTHTSVTTVQPPLSVTIPPHHIKGAIRPPVSTYTFSIPPTSVKNELNESIESNQSVCDEYDPRPDFKAIIPLPDEVEIITGEENESTLFSERGKLYRLDAKEWKERGTGNLKILKSNVIGQGGGRTRILMRREQVHKICANHIITGNMDLKQVETPKKGFLWIANDFSEGVVKLETFFLRFKTDEIANEFKKVFDMAKEEAKEIEAEDYNDNNSETKSSFSFGTSNTKTTSGFVESKISTNSTITTIPVTTNANTTASSFSFNIPTSTSLKATTSNILTETKPEFSTTKSGFSFSIAGQNSSLPKPSITANNIFSLPKTNDKETDDKSTKPNPFASFSFNKTNNNDMTFGSSATTVQNKSFDSIFANLNKSEQVISPQKPVTIVQNTSLTNNEEDDYVPTAQFQPVIALPDIVECKTGEENETILFEHRAKLLRFDSETKEWKDRGIGNMKVLAQKTDQNKVRLLMRREQVLKLCCNQMLKKDTKFNLLPKTDTALTWYGPDYSDNEVHVELLAIRFKTSDVCSQFHNTIIEAQKCMTADNNNDEKTNDTKPIEKEKPENKDKDKAAVKGFGAEFKLKAGSWNCKNCYVSNTADVENCIACNSSKIGLKSESMLSGNTATNTIPNTGKENSKTVQGFGNKFAPAAGSWTCKDCYTLNTSSALHCIACESPKDDTVPKKEPSKNVFGTTSPGQQKFKFGIQPVSTETPIVNTTPIVTTVESKFAFGSPSTNTAPPTTAKTNFTFGKVDANNENKESFSFGIPKSALAFSFGKTDENKSDTKNLFSIDKPTSVTSSPATFNFGNATSQSDKNKFSFGTAPTATSGLSLDKKNTFDFKLKPKSPGKGKNGNIFDLTKTPTVVKAETKKEDKDTNDSDDECIEEENNTFFAPVIPLPDKIDVRTGEEDEIVLYSHRSKLFRFTDGEWKERGIGDVKILKNKLNKKIRILMRRDQVLKICLNHLLTKEIEYKKKDDKSWSFIANDFSEGVYEVITFCLRFKTADIAIEFKNAIDDALNNQDKTITEESKIQDNATDNDKQIIKAPEIVTPLLQLNDCEGCSGCTDDSSTLSLITNNENLIDSDPLPVFNNIKIKNIDENKTIVGKQLNFNDDSDDNNKDDDFFIPKTVNMTNINVSKSPINPIFGDESNKSQNNTTDGTSSSKNNILKPTLFAEVPTVNENSEKVFSNKNDKDVKQPSTEKTFAFGTNKTNFFDNKNFVFNSGPIFGSALMTQNTTQPLTNAIAKETSSTLPSLADQESIFSSPKNNNSLSGGNIFETRDKSPLSTNNSIFGNTLGINSTMGGNLFNIAAQQIDAKTNLLSTGSIFGSANVEFKKPSDAVASSSVTAEANKAENIPSFLSSIDSNLSFGSLSTNKVLNDAVKLDVNESLNALKHSDSVKPWGGLSTTKEFNNFLIGAKDTNDTSKTKDNDKSESGDGVTNDNVDTNNYDPHYDPIIALPDEIVVTTGEENEVKLFGERAKLYRYDATLKEWKERGVGELKILHHPTNGTYRLLMRREQIFKCVLNHSITEQFEMNNMNTNQKAYCWAAVNYAVETSQLEQLAVNFKNIDIATKFKTEISKCIEQLKSRSELEPEED